MVSELQFIPPKLDEDIANAMAIAIAMSSPITYCDFRDAETIVHDLTGLVYGSVRRNGKSNRFKQVFTIPNLAHLQLGLSLHCLREYISRTHSVLFLQSRKKSDFFHYLHRQYNAYKMKVLGDDTNVGEELIELIRKNIQNLLAEEREIIALQRNGNNVSETTTLGSLQQLDISVPAMIGVLNAPLLTDPIDTSVLTNSAKKTNLIKKRNRSSIKEVTLSYELKKMKQKENYRKKMYIRRPINQIKEEMIGDKLVDLVIKQSKYYDIIDGKLCLSIRTGIFIQDLISNCGCSLEKMPIIIGTVLRMLFGNIDAMSMNKIVKCTKTYTTSSERSAALVREQSSSTFIIRNNESSVLNAYLIMDATNKGNKNLVAKLYNYVRGDGVVRLGALNLDNTGTNFNMTTH